MGSKLRGILALAISGAACSGVFYTNSLYVAPTVAGTFVDKDDPSYFIVFRDDGTYIETQYALPRPYTVEGERLTMYNAAGQPVVSSTPKSFKGILTLNINGTVRTLEPTEEQASMYRWDTDSEPSAGCVGVYDIKGTGGLKMHLYDDMSYSISSPEGTTYGKYARTNNRELLLFQDSEGTVECFTELHSGFAFDPMETHLELKEVKANVIDTLGYTAEGTSYHTGSGCSYLFKHDGTVERTDAEGKTVVFFYAINIHGIIEMVDLVGCGEHDCLYVDRVNNTVYRFVLQRDNWHDYLLGITETPETQEEVEENDD